VKRGVAEGIRGVPPSIGRWSWYNPAIAWYDRSVATTELVGNTKPQAISDAS
jgi:hypothetical protein